MTTADQGTTRDAGPKDVDALVALVNSAYRGESSRAGWTTEAHLLEGERIGREEMAQVVADPEGMVLAYEEGGRLLGCVRVHRVERGAHLGMFAVRPDLQDRGIGRRLLAAAEERVVARWGACELEMTVIDSRRELLDWYARRGFARTGERRPFVDGLVFDVLVKRLAKGA